MDFWHSRAEETRICLLRFAPPLSLSLSLSLPPSPPRLYLVKCNNIVRLIVSFRKETVAKGLDNVNGKQKCVSSKFFPISLIFFFFFFFTHLSEASVSSRQLDIVQRRWLIKKSEREKGRRGKKNEKITLVSLFSVYYVTHSKQATI